jgi:moderate conductance mechanosensitive channel
MARLPRFLSIPLLTAVLCAVCLAGAPAQSLPGITLPTAAPGAQLAGGIRQEGLYLTAPVAVDGVPLFRIAVPANVGADQMPVETRDQSIDAAISQILAPLSVEANSGTIYDPKTLHVAVQTVGEQALIVASDGHHPAPVSILTVTGADAKYQRLPVAALAELWRNKLQIALVAALQKRQPAEVQRSVEQLWQVGLALLAASIVAFLINLLLGRRAATLRERIAESSQELETAGSSDPEHPAAARRRRRFMGVAIRLSVPEMELRALKALSGILLALLAFAWFLALIWALALFPQTTQAAHFLRRHAIWNAIVVAGAYVLIRVADLAINRIARSYGEQAQSRRGEERARLLLRIPTIARALSAFATFLIVFAALLLILGGFSANSVLTFGGIAALGITFAAQSLLRDFLNGVFVITEDQYVVGDYVIIDQWSGVVEHMTLRVVQLRDSGGSLITIPHGQVTQVVNCSRDWSRVDYRVAIDPKADVARATEILRAAILALANEERYGDWMIDPVELIGVDALSASGVVLRASVKTAPLRQFELRREINARVLAGFREAGIALGIDPKATMSTSINLGASS